MAFNVHLPGTLRKPQRNDPQSTQTRIIAEFYSFPGKGFSGKSNSDKGFAQLGHITGFSSSKSLGEPAGSFTLTIKKPLEMTSAKYSAMWADPEGGWVLIQAMIDGEPYDVMLGIIDAVSDGVERSEAGTRSETYQIHGRDFGKIFAETSCFFDPYVGRGLAQYQAVTDIIGTRSINATPSDLVALVVRTWLFNKSSGFAGSYPWELPPGMHASVFSDLLNTAGIQEMSNAVHGSVSEMTLLDPGGQTTLWELMQSVSNSVMNELFVDLKWEGRKTGLQPTVTLRERVFPTSTDYGVWEKISTVNVRREDVQRRQLSKGGSGNRFNFWLVTPAGASSMAMRGLLEKSALPSGLPGSVPIVDILSIKRHGLRKKQEESVFIPSPSTDAARQIDWAQLGANWTKKIFDWYSVTPLQVSGSIGLSRIYPEIRIGSRLIETRADGDMSYYVEGVEHSWSYPGTGTTTVTVTRGQPVEVDLLAQVYASLLGGNAAASQVDWQGLDLSTDAIFGVVLK